MLMSLPKSYPLFNEMVCRAHEILQDRVVKPPQK
jgi:hypothetical protein